ncbi:MAG: T9SS type A sorting domain-containing protein [Bacteroidales bacterium]|nr:T9SS type A sorting domain-containing protein [Bacteroidales bacterium]MCF8402993.1 T9SS type A sorting domain-containing protein [Bacteroidales bacterium]
MYYPNPSNGRFQIDAPNDLSLSDIEVRGIFGNKIEFDFQQQPEYIEIIVNENYKGMIIVQLLLNNDRITKKVLIK